MIDERDLVEQAVRALVRQKPAFDDLIRRRDRKRRNQRIAAGVVGIVGFVAAVWIVTSVGSVDRTHQPATQPTPMPTPNLRGADYVLDLETRATTPVPWRIRMHPIRENGHNGYAVSPDGSKVAYYGPLGDGSSRGLFVARRDGTRVRLIARDVAQTSWTPAWSPVGTTIAYVGRADGEDNGNIFVVDLSNGGTTQVTFETVPVSGTGFSPDGSSIVYTAQFPDFSEVRIVPATGGTGSRLVGGDGSDAAGASFSPDGSLLSYVCGPALSSDLCLANADGSDARVIVRGDKLYGIMTASWSPDGSRIAYWKFHRWWVLVMDVATGDTTRVGRGAWPSWVDDHTLIIEPYNGPA